MGTGSHYVSSLRPQNQHTITSATHLTALYPGRPGSDGAGKTHPVFVAIIQHL